MPNQPATPVHCARVDDELWDDAKRVAEDRGETISDAVRWGLAEYVRRWPGY